MSAQLQLECLNYFERHCKQTTENHLSLALFESVVLPCLVMVLTMQQTAIGLLSDDEGEYEIPQVVIQFFNDHLHNLDAGANGLAFAQD